MKRKSKCQYMSQAILHILLVFQVDVSEVTQMVAQDSEKKGLHEDAVKLYDLAKVCSHFLFTFCALTKKIFICTIPPFVIVSLHCLLHFVLLCSISMTVLPCSVLAESREGCVSAEPAPESSCTSWRGGWQWGSA